MSSPTLTASGNCSPSLRSLPSELTVQMFCQLPLFLDVFALSTASRRLRNIWSTNVTHIYSRVAPKSVAYERHARRFLTHQGGPVLKSPISTVDVARMVRNASVVKRAIVHFEREIVCRVRKADLCKAHELEECYDAGARGHPPTLAHTERARFIRTYYTLWGMMKLEPSPWKSRLEATISQELYYLHEMTKLTQNIGREKIVPPHPFPNQPPDSVHSINSGQSEKRVTLGETIWQHIQDTSQRIFNQDALYPEVYAKHEGFLWFVVMWDHWQPSLKDMVLHQSTSSIRPSPELVERYLCDDGLEEPE